MPVCVAAFGASDTVDQARPYHGKPRISFDGGHLGEIRRERVADVVFRAVQRRDGAGDRRTGGPAVVAHDEDRVGAAGRGRGLRSGSCRCSAVVSNVSCAPGTRASSCVRIGLDQRRELVRATRRDRLEVEVDPVCAAVGHGLGGLRGEVCAGDRVAEERADCVAASLVLHANSVRHSTTRTPFWWAVLITLVSLLLVQPAQPVDVVPSLFVLTRLPDRSTPTLK